MAGTFDPLAKMSLARRLGLLGAMVLFVLVAYYQLFFTSLSDERDQLEGQQRSLLNEQNKLDKDLEEMRRLARVYMELEQSIRDNQRALPTEAELPAFFDHLQRKAVDAGVTIRSWERLKEEPVDMYVRVPVRVNVVGSFLNLMKYFYLLGPPQGGDTPEEAESVRINERIVSVAELSLGDPKVLDDEVQLTASFIASTFRQAAAPAGAEPDLAIEKILEAGGVKDAKQLGKEPAPDGAGKPGEAGKTGGAQ